MERREPGGPLRVPAAVRNLGRTGGAKRRAEGRKLDAAGTKGGCKCGALRLAQEQDRSTAVVPGELESGSMDERPTHRTTDEARAGSTPGIVRWVLLASLILALIAMGLVLAFSMRNDRATPDSAPPERAN